MATRNAVSGGGWKPSPQQELLLRAALWQGDAARAAWNEWIAQTDLRALDYGSHRLLPLLYLNLVALEVKHPAVQDIRAVYRHFWYRNQLILRRATTALRSLAEADIPTMVLKACALIPLYYHDPAARPMTDIDILVPTLRARQAVETLCTAGWQPSALTQMDNTYFQRTHAHTLHLTDHFQIDLHRHVLMFETRVDGDAEFWANSIPVRLKDVQTRALNPADQLLHICAHGAEWNNVPPVRWAADAYMLLRESEVDWAYLLKQVSANELGLLARNSLLYLSAALKANIPKPVLDELVEWRVSRQEHIRYELLTYPHSEHNTALKLWYHYEQFRRLDHVYKNENWFLRFPAFLRDTWGLSSTRAVPTYMMRYLTHWFARRIKFAENSPTDELSEN